MAERNLNVSIQKRVIFTDDQRRDYSLTIAPYVLAAKEAYQPISNHRNQLKILDKERKQVEIQIRADSVNTNDETHPLVAALVGISLSRDELMLSPLLSDAKEEFRLKANELIAEVNRWKAKAALDSGLIKNGSTSLIGQRQIPPEKRKNLFTQVSSPIKPHNALGTLSIYREKAVRPDLAHAIRTHSRSLVEISFSNADVSLAMVQLVPEHITTMNRFSPFELRKPEDLGKQIVELAFTVGKYDAGLLEPPSAEDLGLTSAQQEMHPSAYLISPFFKG